MPIADQSTPSADEIRPEIGPNLASDPELCKDVLQYIFREYYYPALLNQQRLQPVWTTIDRAWRCLTPASSLDYDPLNDRSENWLKYVKNGKGNNGAAAVTPSDFFQQTKVLGAMAYSLSWQNGIPCRFKKPSTLVEHPYYNPTQKSVDIANERLEQEAELADLAMCYRKSYADYLRFSHAWCLWDYDRRFEQVMDPSSGGMALVPKTFYTTAQKLNIDQVYIDYLSPVNDMTMQDCPVIRRMISKTKLFDNDYEPNTNPFGWMNVDLAVSKQEGQYAYSQQDMEYASNLLKLRQNITDTSAGMKAQNTVHQLYTSWAMLPIYQDDKGKWKLAKDPIKQVAEDGTETTVFPRPKRYVVEWYGYTGTGAQSTCLRIQRNPTPKDRVPITCSVHLIEDQSMAIPVSISEIAYSAFEQLTTAYNQFLDSKNYTINRPYFVPRGEDLEKVNLNQPGKNIPCDDPSMIRRAEGNSFDDTATLIPFMQSAHAEIQNLFGGKDAIMGEIASGRRSASEMSAVIDSARTPIVVDVDNFNAQFAKGYATAFLNNLNAWGDRDWIKKKTGLIYFPQMEVQTTMAKEFVDKMLKAQDTRYFLEFLNRNPLLSQYIATPSALIRFGKDMGVDGLEEVIDDGGLERAKVEGMQIVTSILGDGRFTPPLPDDNDQVLIQIFQQALKDPYWYQHAPQNIPLLVQRLEMQQQQAMLKQMQAMQAQLQQQIQQAQMGGGMQSPQSKPASTRGGVAQESFGAALGG